MKVFLALSIALAITTAQAQQPTRATSKPTSPEIGRFQLITAPVDDGASSEKTVFLLDTMTGKVWKFQPAWTSTDSSGKKTSVAPLFIPIDFIKTFSVSGPLGQ